MANGLFIRAGAYVFALAVLLLVCRLKRLPLRDTLGLYVPKTREALLYSFFFICLVTVGEWFASILGLSPAAKWHAASHTAMAIRILSIVVLAPAMEELLFRGLLYTQINKTRLKAMGAIALPALLFTAAHYDKQLTAATYVLLVQIFIDGVYFGLIRYKTNSTLLTIVLHAAGNSFAVFQRMT